MKLNNLTAHRKELQRYWLHPRDCCLEVTQTYNNGAETHLVCVAGLWSLLSPRCPPSLPSRANDPTVIGSVALRKGPRRFCPHRSDRWCLFAETHPCGNVVSAVIMFCLRFGCHGSLELDHLNSVSSCDMCINWNESQVSRLQLYKQPSPSNDTWVRAGGCKQSLPRYPKGWVGPATRSAVATCII